MMVLSLIVPLAQAVSNNKDMLFALALEVASQMSISLQMDIK